MRGPWSLATALGLAMVFGLSLGALAPQCLVAEEAGLAPAPRALAESTIEPDVLDLFYLGPTRPVLLRLHVTIDGQPFRQAWQARFEELFSLEDRDGDGRLDAEGAKAVERDMNGTLADTPPSKLDQIVADGTIDRAALAEHLRRTLSVVVLRPRAVVGQGAALALFPLLDTDGDLLLSSDELAAAGSRLVERDFDDNLVVSAGELILDPKAIAAAADPEASEAALDADQTPLVLFDEWTTAEQLAERLRAHYDRNRDGRLTLHQPGGELKLPLAARHQWDADGNEELSPQELSGAKLWLPDLQLSFALGQASARAARERRSPRHPEGYRVRKKLLGGYDLDLGEAQIDFDRNNRDPQSDFVEFGGYDRDNNKYVDPAEATASNIGKMAFAAMDVDGNGQVFKGELTTFLTRQNAAAAVRLHLVVRDLGQDLFGQFDLDMDGLLSPRELAESPSLLAVGDTNGDGCLGFDEVPARLEFELVRGVDEPADAEVRLVRRVGRPQDRTASDGPAWYRKMDRNNDGDLSPGEFIGPRAAFERLDANGDHLIDRDEAEAAEK